MTVGTCTSNNTLDVDCCIINVLNAARPGGSPKIRNYTSRNAIRSRQLARAKISKDWLIGCSRDAALKTLLLMRCHQ
eukprot:scaffold21476_cov88-Skeletonema_dohrnii-CCMP3373.AAC.2